jgi:hypothetical protein
MKADDVGLERESHEEAEDVRAAVLEKNRLITLIKMTYLKSIHHSI